MFDESKGSVDPVLRATVWGAFRLSTRDGADVTPRAAKSQALVAALLLSPQMTKPRSELARLLWSDRARPQALASIRQALVEIRAALGPAREALQADRSDIWFARGSVVTDLDSFPEGKELFEGVSIRDRAFETWLRRMREIHRREQPGPGFPWVRVRGDGDSLHSSLLSDGIAESITDWCAERVASSVSGDLEEDAARFIINNKAFQAGTGVLGDVRLRNGQGPETLWSAQAPLSPDPMQLIEEHGLHRLINRSVDRTIFELASPHRDSEEGRYLERGALGAIRLIFRNGEGDLEAAQRQLQENYEICNRGIYAAWKAYTLTFLKAERNQADLDELREEGRELVARAIEMEPHSAMVMALCSFVTTFLLQDKENGHALGTRAIELNRSNPLAWMFRGAANFYSGNPERAYADTSFARAIAGDGPYRYVVELYGCIAATLTDRLDEATRLGESSSLQSPVFKAPLRYLAMIYAARGDEAALHRTLEKLRVLEPEFSLQAMAEASYPVPALRNSPRLAEVMRRM